MFVYIFRIINVMFWCVCGNLCDDGGKWFIDFYRNYRSYSEKVDCDLIIRLKVLFCIVDFINVVIYFLSFCFMRVV